MYLYLYFIVKQDFKIPLENFEINLQLTLVYFAIQ